MKFNETIGIDARFMLRPLRGIPLYVLRLCQNLPSIDRNYQFIYFINKGFEHNTNPENYMPRIQEIERNNPNVTFVNYDDDAEIKWEQIYLPCLIKKYKVDLLHMPANRICFFPGVPTVATVHDVMEYRYLLDEKYPLAWAKNRSLRMLQFNLRRRLYAIYMYRYALKKGANLITVSQYSANDIKNTLSLRSKHIEVIHHGVDSDYLVNDPPPLENRPFTLMLGGDSYQKNPEAALACWSQVDSALREKYPLRIIGFGGSPSSPLFQSLHKYGLSSSVEVRGWVTQEEMVECFQQAALFLFPSRCEGFGFPLIQAMASGTPVVSTNRTSIPEVLGSVGLQYDPDDHRGMAAGVESLLANRDLWLEQSMAGISRARQFTWKNSARAHLDVYARLLGKSGE